MPKIEAMIAAQIGQAMPGDSVGEMLASAIEIVGAEHRVARKEVAAAQARGLLLLCSCGAEKCRHDGPPSADGREMMPSRQVSALRGAATPAPRRSLRDSVSHFASRRERDRAPRHTRLVFALQSSPAAGRRIQRWLGKPRCL